MPGTVSGDCLDEVFCQHAVLINWNPIDRCCSSYHHFIEGMGHSGKLNSLLCVQAVEAGLITRYSGSLDQFCAPALTTRDLPGRTAEKSRM